MLVIFRACYSYKANAHRYQQLGNLKDEVFRYRMWIEQTYTLELGKHIFFYLFYFLDELHRPKTACSMNVVFPPNFLVFFFDSPFFMLPELEKSGNTAKRAQNLRLSKKALLVKSLLFFNK